MRQVMLKGIAVVAGAFIAGPSVACAVLEPFEMARIGGAELVLVGEVTGYQDLGTPWGAALVTVAVEEALKGEVVGEVTFIWNAGMAQGPHETQAQGVVLIGARREGRIAVSNRAPDARPDLPSIVQPYCGEVWMQPATAGTVAAAREALE
jgi:hypothetical protein